MYYTGKLQKISWALYFAKIYTWEMCLFNQSGYSISHWRDLMVGIEGQGSKEYFAQYIYWWDRGLISEKGKSPAHDHKAN